MMPWTVLSSCMNRARQRSIIAATRIYAATPLSLDTFNLTLDSL